MLCSYMPPTDSNFTIEYAAVESRHSLVLSTRRDVSCIQPSECKMSSMSWRMSTENRCPLHSPWTLHPPRKTSCIFTSYFSHSVGKLRALISMHSWMHKQVASEVGGDPMQLQPSVATAVDHTFDKHLLHCFTNYSLHSHVYTIKQLSRFDIGIAQNADCPITKRP